MAKDEIRTLSIAGKIHEATVMCNLFENCVARQPTQNVAEISAASAPDYIFFKQTNKMFNIVHTHLTTSVPSGGMTHTSNRLLPEPIEQR